MAPPLLPLYIDCTFYHIDIWYLYDTSYIIISSDINDIYMISYHIYTRYTDIIHRYTHDYTALLYCRHHIDDHPWRLHIIVYTIFYRKFYSWYLTMGFNLRRLQNVKPFLCGLKLQLNPFVVISFAKPSCNLFWFSFKNFFWSVPSSIPVGFDIVKIDFVFFRGVVNWLMSVPYILEIRTLADVCSFDWLLSEVGFSMTEIPILLTTRRIPVRYAKELSTSTLAMLVVDVTSCLTTDLAMWAKFCLQ